MKEIVKNTEDINNYDFSKMIKDFETSQRCEMNQKKIKKKWEDIGKKYKMNIELIKELKEEKFKKRSRNLMSQIKKKEALLITSLETQQKNRLREKKRAISLLLEKKKLANEIVEKFEGEREQKRLIFEKTTKKKCIYIFF